MFYKIAVKNERKNIANLKIRFSAYTQTISMTYLHDVEEYVLLPEDILPDEAREYRKCEICTDKSPIIWGEGNPHAPITVILDNPGARKTSDGRPFVCGVRQTLQTAIHNSHLAIDDIYVTYLLKCRPLKKYDKEKVRAFSMPFLINQIKKLNPRILVCLGDVVIKTLFNDTQTSVKELRGEWREIIGIPTIVSYHPLAVRRSPKSLMPIFLKDWELLSQRFISNN